jgi:hypothetical protein
MTDGMAAPLLIFLLIISKILRTIEKIWDVLKEARGYHKDSSNSKRVSALVNAGFAKAARMKGV